ncbi:retroviral-like aspartic protease family protein, partial [Thiolapillus sp.]|uniref:retroviral-like aspartic protease family protein n=1 Tax=Thiolapillus sp. TaxID=2017437 RepID=UPI003AF444C8
DTGANTVALSAEHAAGMGIDYLRKGRPVMVQTASRVVKGYQACLRPRDRFWDIPVPKIDSAFDNPLVPQPSWSPSTTQQLRKLVAAPYLAPNDWTPRSEAYFVFPLAQGTPGKQCGLAATGVYQPSLRSPWLAADVRLSSVRAGSIRLQNIPAVVIEGSLPEKVLLGMSFLSRL